MSDDLGKITAILYFVLPCPETAGKMGTDSFFADPSFYAYAGCSGEKGCLSPFFPNRETKGTDYSVPFVLHCFRNLLGVLRFLGQLFFYHSRIASATGGTILA